MRRRLALLLAAAVGSTGALTVAAGPVGAAETRPFVLTSGHIDLFEVSYDDDSDQLDLQVKDDTRLYDEASQHREPEDVTVGVDADLSAVTIPAGLPPDYAFLGDPGDTIYLLPFTQDPRLPWPGWSTERLAATLPAGLELPDTSDAVELSVAVEGPGDVHSYMSGPTGDVTNHYIDTTDGGPDTIPVPRNAHVHTEWVFTEPGSYTMAVSPTATTVAGQELTGATSTYHFQVGPDEPVGDLELSVTPDKPDATYLYGQGITLTAAPSQETELDHYHWFVKAAGAEEFVISDRSTTAELRLPTSLQWDGAEVYASLYDGDHEPVASSEPLTLHVSALEPTTVLGTAADKPAYRVGDVAHFTSTQDPPTADDHYHWYVRKPGEEFYTYITGADAAAASLGITADMDGASVIARLFNHDHAVLAESAPLTLAVDDSVAAATSTKVAINGAPQTYGTSRPARVQVSVSSAAGPASGAVSLRVGPTVVASGVSLGADGRAVVTMPRRLVPGSHAVRAAFLPADPAAESASQSAQVALKVTKAPTKVTAKLARKRITAAERARVIVNVAGPAERVGKVTVSSKGKRLATARVVNGKVTVKLPRLRVGRHQIVVRFAGSDLLASAASAKQVLTVVRR